MSTDPAPIPVEQLGYEQARDELIEVVATLERGGLDLDASLALWERGETLANRCEEHLAGARERIEAALSGSTDDDGADGDTTEDGTEDDEDADAEDDEDPDE